MLPQGVYLCLQPFEKVCGVGAVHLGMMELEGDCQGGLEKAPFILAPDGKRVIEDATVHAHCAVNVILGQGRGPYSHTVRQVVVLAALPNPSGKGQIVPVELGQIRGEGYITGADPVFSVQDDGVYGKTVIADQFLTHGECVELLNAAGGFADAPAHQHIEFEALSATAAQQPGHIQGLEESKHRYGRMEPQGIGLRPLGFLWIDFGHDFSFHKKKTWSRTICSPRRRGSGRRIRTLVRLRAGAR